MTATIDALAAALPHALPDHPDQRLLLFVMRRMAAHGLHDAQAAHALLSAFGQGYRRPLVLLRALMAELARRSQCTIPVAPCCCPRMTPAESALLHIARRATGQQRTAHLLLSDLLGTRDCIGALTSMQAVATAFADAGRPLD